MRLPRLGIRRLFNPPVPRPRGRRHPRPFDAPTFGDGLASPGEVVWAWVPYEEDTTSGKDRPVLVLEVDGDAVLAAPMTSVDHDRDADQEAAAGRHWMDLGTGSWDPRGRSSEVRLDRVVRLLQSEVRREGGVVDAELFQQVLEATRRYR